MLDQFVFHHIYMSVCVQGNEATEDRVKDIWTGKEKDFGHLGQVNEMASYPYYKRLGW